MKKPIAHLLFASLMIGGSSLLVLVGTDSSAATLPPITHLTVLHDTGKGLPVQAFVGTALKRLDDSKAQAKYTEPVSQAPSMEQLLKLPLRSALTLGVQPHIQLPDDVAKGVTQTMFILGSDDTSRAWLVEHEEWLFQRNAVGYLVQAETLADVDRMLSASKLPMAVINLDQIVTGLNITHYPVIINREGAFHRAEDVTGGAP